MERIPQSALLSFIHSFSQQLFIEGLLCARHWLGGLIIIIRGDIKREVRMSWGEGGLTEVSNPPPHSPAQSLALGRNLFLISGLLSSLLASCQVSFAAGIMEVTDWLLPFRCSLQGSLSQLVVRTQTRRMCHQERPWNPT